MKKIVAMLLAIMCTCLLICCGDSTFGSSDAAPSTSNQSSTSDSSSTVANVSYKVEYYYENENGVFVIDATLTENKTGKEGTTVSAGEQNKLGYVFDESNQNNVLSVALESDGAVLKRYYMLATFTVTFDTTTNDIGVSFASQTIKANSKVARPDDSKKDASDINYWTLDGEIFDFDTPITGNITLVAVPIQYSPLG